jgi:hypothetical protein
MANTKWVRSAGTVSATVATIVAGIVVNLGILGANPNSPGGLALAASRATPNQRVTPHTRGTTSTTEVTTTLPTVTISVPTIAQPVTAAPVSTPPSLAPFEPARQHTPPSSPTTVQPTTTTTPSHTPQPQTFAVPGVGSIEAMWTGEAVSITVHARRGWKVTVLRPSRAVVRVIFRRRGHRILWRARIVGRKVRVHARSAH